MKINKHLSPEEAKKEIVNRIKQDRILSVYHEVAVIGAAFYHFDLMIIHTLTVTHFVVYGNRTLKVCYNTRHGSSNE